MISLTRRAMGASTLAILAGCATGHARSGCPDCRCAPPPAAIGSFGVDLAARDLNVKPGDDFFRYANGTWLANTQIPADRTRWGTFDMLRDKADRDQRVIIEEVALAGGAAGSNQQKIADYLQFAFSTRTPSTRVGLAPLQARARADRCAAHARANHPPHRVAWHRRRLGPIGIFVSARCSAIPTATSSP